MARYAIGDIQGCWDELQALLFAIDFDPARDVVYPVGDLVNRGPGSLQVLRWAREQGDAVQVVLGNHDLHLLACFAGHGTLKGGDTIGDVLAAPDAEALADWLRRQPLLRVLDDTVIVHAGVWPRWSLKQAVAACAEVEAALAVPDWQAAFVEMYGNKPAHWKQAESRIERCRFTINACTRMRFVDEEGALQLKFKGEVADAPKGLTPWFDAPRKALPRVVCGHWSALGLMMRDEVWALDTGCIWGGLLTAVDLDTSRIIQVPAQKAYQALE
ncbi:symmetrical bis(5'-nucleosyl)-tetraphosphatase [Chitinolyticbacter meiyuanensis]|uniref:symmetrical bis(5'-nucleosyl)-tetraphosphatase n=1 Tax=Chitinolyticbacter meiyuanensis TaxID=682798 RepID=UPI0011E59F22|nr:symmetrical bis(5'-nucleosyl)-tetraphosphatase [Chitinolyticbacter meiyuanensis]